MGLDEHVEDEEVDKYTAIVFPNPEHGEVEANISDEEKAKEYYEDVVWMRSVIGSNSSEVVGQFISSLRKAEEEGDFSELDELVEKIKI